MKTSFTAVSWLAVPLAAAAGYVGSRQHHAAPKEMPAEILPKTETASGQATAAAAVTGFVGTWTTRLAKCTAADLPGLYAGIQRLPEKDDIRRAMLLLCARWVELDAPEGLAFFSALDDKILKTSGRISLLTEWALMDPLAAYGVIKQQPEKEAEADITNIGHALVNQDPDKFWIWFQKARQPLPGSWGVETAWQAVAAAHLDELSTIAAELLAGEIQAGSAASGNTQLEGLYSLLAAAMAERNPDKSVEWARQLPESVRHRALTGALEVLVKKSPEKIGDYLTLLQNRQTGGSFYIGSGAEFLIEKAVGALLQRDTLKALDWLRNNYNKLGAMPDMVCRQFGKGLADAMRAGKMTPEAAFASVRAAKEYNGAIRSGVLTTMWEGLPSKQLATTAVWLSTLESKDAAKLALQGIFPEWIKQDQAAALAFAATLEDREIAAKMFEKLAEESSAGLVITKGERMANTLKLIPPEYRAEIMDRQIRMHYGGVMMDHSGPFDGAATSAALEGLAPGPATEKAYSRVASVWGASEPEAALAWATGQSDSALRKAATGAAVEGWAKEDAWGTSQWIASLPPGGTRDTASHHLARALRREEPASAWTWAGSIGDPATRLEAQTAVLQEWRNASALEAAGAVQGLAQTLAPGDYQRLVEALVPAAESK